MFLLEIYHYSNALFLHIGMKNEWLIQNQCKQITPAARKTLKMTDDVSKLSVLGWPRLTSER